MIKTIDIKKILNRKDVVFIDVRSEKEFNDDTIPGAINLPILNNNEREYVGYLYKQIDEEKAKELGLEYASSKLAFFYKKIKEIKDNNNEIALFCYRGGMRSNSVANVMDTMGINVFLIEGGYKSYRKYVLEELNSSANKFNYIVLHGYTGVGKTKILRALENIDEPVIDLEFLAQNSGSVFGKIGYNNSNITQKKFESKLVNSIKNIDRNYIFIESESKRIGKVNLPDFLMNDIDNGLHVLIDTSMDTRIKNIIDEYIKNSSSENDKEIMEAIDKLRKRLSNNVVDELIEKIKHKQYKYVAERLMENYYDPLYKYSIDKVNGYDKIIKYEYLDDAVRQLISFKNKCCK